MGPYGWFRPANPTQQFRVVRIEPNRHSFTWAEKGILSNQATGFLVFLLKIEGTGSEIDLFETFKFDLRKRSVSIGSMVAALTYPVILGVIFKSKLNYTADYERDLCHDSWSWQAVGIRPTNAPGSHMWESIYCHSHGMIDRVNKSRVQTLKGTCACSEDFKNTPNSLPSCYHFISIQKDTAAVGPSHCFPVRWTTGASEINVQGTIFWERLKKKMPKDIQEYPF